MMTLAEPLHSAPSTFAARSVVVVTKHAHPDVLDSLLDAGHYDVVFIESLERAYSHIKRVTPHLVIVCVDIDDIDGFQVLTMLKLDSATAQIPVWTYLTTAESRTAHDLVEPERFSSRYAAAVSMN